MVLTELVFPPFGYLLAYDNASPTDTPSLGDNPLAYNRFRDRRTMTMNFALLPTISPFPGDYRDRTKMEADKAETDAVMEARRRGRERAPVAFHPSPRE